MRQGEISLVGVLALFSMYLMWKSAELPIGYIRGQGPGGGFWPFWLSLGMLLSCASIAWNWSRGKSPASASDEPLMDAFGWRTVMLVGGGCSRFRRSGSNCVDVWRRLSLYALLFTLPR